MAEYEITIKARVRTTDIAEDLDLNDDQLERLYDEIASEIDGTDIEVTLDDEDEESTDFVLDVLDIQATAK